MRIVFFGTPEFAVTSLNALINKGYEIPYVVTVEDKKAGRGQRISMSPIKIHAEKHQIPILQPTNLKNETFINTLADIKADLFIVVAFRKLPKELWSLPRIGTINLHASLLPDYRGAAPINWAIINGEKITGLTTFFIDEKIDTGDILMKKEVKIEDHENAGSLHDKLMIKGAELIVNTIEGIAGNSIKTTVQKHSVNLKKAPKINKNDCIISWSGNCADIYNFIRGLSPYPCAATKIDGKVFKVYQADKMPEKHDYPVGKIISDNKNHLHITCQDGYINLLEVQLEGKKRMPIREFLKGYQFVENIITDS